MNPAATLSRSVSGKHLSFHSNLQGLNYHLSAPAPAPAAARRGVRRLSESLSFTSRLYAHYCESNCILSGGQFGFDYAKERLEKRQIFLRSYHFTTEAEASSNSRNSVCQKGKGCLFRIRTALWTVIACNPPRACDKHHSNRHDFPVKGFVHIHRHANAWSLR